MPSKWVFILTCALALNACGEDRVPTPNADGHTTTTSRFSKSYHLTFNGCDSGRHEFSSDDEKDVLNQYCRALQNRGLNNGCPDDIRHDKFATDCPGYTWNP